MGAVDPSYPLLPIASILAAVMLLLVLLTASIRQQLNFGVAVLCSWLLLQNITAATDTIMWSDNTDIRLLAYCDIVSHLQVLLIVVKPMATLIITRRLYLVVSARSVNVPSKAARVWEQVLEWSLGVVIPVLIAGPVYYADQSSRFEMDEGFGCTNAADDSIFAILLINGWSVAIPLLSTIFYYPKVARTFYLSTRDVNRFAPTDNSVSRTSFVRLFVLASIDILITLPVGITGIVLNTSAGIASGHFPFYSGWKLLHSDWEPVVYTYPELLEAGPAYLAEFYFSFWSSTFLSFVVFALFGTSTEARALYWRPIFSAGSWFGWTPAGRKTGKMNAATMGTICFDAPPLEMSIDVESGLTWSTLVNANPVESLQGVEEKISDTS